MRNLKEKFLEWATQIMCKLPGGDLRCCQNISPQCSDCVRHRNHAGKCEDAWFYKWNSKDSI